MPDEIQQGQEVVTQPTGEELQPTAMPTVEVPQEQVVEGLPQDASERTKQEFEKLKEHNKQLATENARLKSNTPQPPSLLESYLFAPPPPLASAPAPQMPQMPQQPMSLPQTQAEPVAQGVVDAEGYLNQPELERRFKLAEEARKQAQEAQQQAQQAMERVARFEATAQVNAVYTEFPELDPSSPHYDEDAFVLVRNEMIGQLAASGTQDAVRAARNMSKYFRKAPTVTPAQQQVLQERSQALAGTGSGTSSTLNAAEEGELRKRSLHDDAAMDERIKRAGI